MTQHTKTPHVITERCPYWDGNIGMRVIHDDGGRLEAGWRGSAGDCVVRAIAIAAELPYGQVYDDLRQHNIDFAASRRNAVARQISKKGGTPRDGTFKDIYRPYLESLGFRWVPTMRIGSGCTVNLVEGALPNGRIIARLSKHLTAVIDQVIHDTFNPQRATIHVKDGIKSMAHRCVYGYFEKAREA